MSTFEEIQGDSKANLRPRGLACRYLLVKHHHLQGYLAHKKTPTPQDHQRTLGIALLQGPRGVRLIMSEVPLCRRGLAFEALDSCTAHVRLTDLLGPVARVKKNTTYKTCSKVRKYEMPVQGHLAHKKQPPPRTLHSAWDKNHQRGGGGSDLHGANFGGSIDLDRIAWIPLSPSLSPASPTNPPTPSSPYHAPPRGCVTTFSVGQEAGEGGWGL